MGTLSWCVAIGLFISYTQNLNIDLLYISSLFAIAGAIAHRK